MSGCVRLVLDSWVNVDGAFKDSSLKHHMLQTLFQGGRVGLDRGVCVQEHAINPGFY